MAQRNDEGFIDDLATRGVAYVQFFPLGGFTPLQSPALDAADAIVVHLIMHTIDRMQQLV